MIAQFVPPYDKLRLEEVDGMEGVLLEPLKFYSAQLHCVVMAPSWMETDYASIPRGLWNILPKRGKHDRAAVLHDAGYRGHLQTHRGEPVRLRKDDVDRLFLEALEVCGVGWLTRQAMFKAVSWFGGTAYANGQRIREALRVGDEAV